MKYSKRRNLLCGMVLGAVTMITPAHPGTLLGPEYLGAYEFAFATSFRLDICGDRSLGEIYRQAILAKLNYCPFTTNARTEFLHKAESIRALVDRSQTGANSQVPEFLGDLQKNPEACKELRQNSEYLKERATIEQYSRGELTVDEFPFRSCTPQVGL